MHVFVIYSYLWIRHIFLNMTLDGRSTPSQIINVKGNDNLMFVKKHICMFMSGKYRSMHIYSICIRDFLSGHYCIVNICFQTFHLNVCFRLIKFLSKGLAMRRDVASTHVSNRSIHNPLKIR